MVFEDALFHIVDYLVRETGSDQLILSGGTALNAIANMRLLDRFDAAYYKRTLGKYTRLHLWVPPVPGDAGVTIGAAYMFAHLAGAGIGPPLEHAFYCGFAPAEKEIRAALEGAQDIAWKYLGDIVSPDRRNEFADFMAYMTAQDGVFAIFQGPAETGPRALGHRSIVANPCNPRIRDVLNQRVKYREAIRPLAPMMTLEAAQQFFELSDGASDDNYNAYNYMVLTARAKPEAHARIPAVIHADGTGRLQIVREHTDPLNPDGWPAANISPAARSICCCRTGSIVATSFTKTQPTPASTRPSSIRNFGRSCRTSSRPTGTSAPWRWARRRRACWQA